MNESNTAPRLTEAAQQARLLRAELEADSRAMRQFLSSASLVESAYTQALGRVSQSLKALGQSLTAAAAAGLNLVSRLLNAVQPAANALSGALTRLFGVSVWKSGSKAIESTSSALNKVTRSVRSAAKAQRELYSFDQITRVSASSGSGSSAGSGSGGKRAGGGSGDGEWLRIPGLLDRWAAQAKSVLSRIWQPFQAAWSSQGAPTLAAAKNALSEIGQAAAAVGSSWLSVWTDGSGERMVTTVLQIVQRLCQTAGTLADRFREAWTDGGAGESIFRALSDIAQTVLDTLNQMASATAVWAAQLNFSGLVSGFSKLVSALQPLAQALSGALYWGYTNVLLPLSGWVIQAAGPAMLSLLTGAVNLLTAGLNLLKPVGNFVWSALLQPMGNWAGTLLISGLKSAAAGFQALANTLNALPSGWEALRSKASQLWDNIRSAITGSANGCRTGAASAFAGLTGDVNKQSGLLKSKVQTAFTSLSSIVKNRLSGISGALSAPFKNGFNAVVSLLNRLIRKINRALKFSWKAVKILGQVVVPAGSVTLAQLPTISALASGGITQGATLSLIGEAGREAVLPLERNTDWMDQLAGRLAQAVSGGETRVQVYVGGRQLTEQVIQEVNTMTRRSGRCPIYV